MQSNVKCYIQGHAQKRGREGQREELYPKLHPSTLKSPFFIKYIHMHVHVEGP